jgi:hypothetical protein
MRTLAFQSTANAGRPYLAILHTAEAPHPEEWTAYARAVGDAASSAVGTLHAFAVTDGGGPSSTQRKQLGDAFSRGTGSSVTHVFTTSAFVRGIVTAFHWMGWSAALAHHPSDFGRVVAGCGLSPVAVLGTFASLQTEVPRVQALRMVEDAMKSSIWRALR